MKALLTIALSLFTLCGYAADAPKAGEKKPDPIVGKWRWSHKNFIIDILADGTTRGGDYGSGTWKAAPGTSAERKYVLTWREGEGVDTITLSQDGKKLAGKAVTGMKFSATRVE